jgi:hypothetical protein
MAPEQRTQSFLLASRNCLCNQCDKRSRIVPRLRRKHQNLCGSASLTRALKTSCEFAENVDIRCQHRKRQPDLAVNRIEVCDQGHVASDGYRLLWFRSACKAAHDRAARSQRCQRAIQELQPLKGRLLLPRTQFRSRSQVEQAVAKILADRKMESLLKVDISETEVESFRPMGRGRPTKNSKYRREVTTRFDIAWHVNDQGWRDAEVDDGVFPLITNDRSLTPKEVLQAYKRQRFGIA